MAIFSCAWSLFSTAISDDDWNYLGHLLIHSEELPSSFCNVNVFSRAWIYIYSKSYFVLQTNRSVNQQSQIDFPHFTPPKSISNEESDASDARTDCYDSRRTCRQNGGKVAVCAVCILPGHGVVAVAPSDGPQQTLIWSFWWKFLCRLKSKDPRNPRSSYHLQSSTYPFWNMEKGQLVSQGLSKGQKPQAMISQNDFQALVTHAVATSYPSTERIILTLLYISYIIAPCLNLLSSKLV